MAISIGWLISAAVFSIRATILYFHTFDSNPYPCCFLFAQTPPLAIPQRSCGEQLQISLIDVHYFERVIIQLIDECEKFEQAISRVLAG
jgi:hypothetical protein